MSDPTEASSCEAAVGSHGLVHQFPMQLLGITEHSMYEPGMSEHRGLSASSCEPMPLCLKYIYYSFCHGEIEQLTLKSGSSDKTWKMGGLVSSRLFCPTSAVSTADIRTT